MSWPPIVDVLKRGTAGLGRGCAVFVGVFTLLNLLGDWRHPGFDATLWWIDLRRIDSTVRWWFLFVTAALCLRFAVAPGRPRWLDALLAGTLFVLIAVCVVNAYEVWRLIRSEQIRTSFPLPFSVVMIGILTLILVSVLPLRREFPWSRWSQAGWMCIGMCGCGLLFTVGQMYCFGSTDYRRPAEAAVVFGCRVFGNGTPSHALRDRVRTAAELYRDGLVRRLILSGGPGDGPIHETEAMRRLAIEYGVEPTDVLLDPDGLNTEATVANTLRLMSSEQSSRLLAVSHFYHLPRVKLCFQRHGADVYTVPAHEEYPLRGRIKFMAREVLALLWYYIAPAFDAGARGRGRAFAAHSREDDL